jgi:hypothetical protein
MSGNLLEPAARVSVLAIARTVVLAVFLFAGNRMAGADDRKEQKFDVSVWAIRATKSNSEVSPELRPIAKELRKRFKYTGFKLERKRTGKVGTGKALSVDLVAGFKAKVTPVERQGSRVKLKIEVSRRQGKKERPLLNTVVTLNRGRFHLQGGWKIEQKTDDVLIVAVSAR